MKTGQNWPKQANIMLQLTPQRSDSTSVELQLLLQPYLHLQYSCSAECSHSTVQLRNSTVTVRYSTVRYRTVQLQ